MTQQINSSASKGILYEHEMIRPETKEMRALRWGCGAPFVIILSTILILPMLPDVLSFQFTKHGFASMLFFSFALSLIFLLVKTLVLQL